MTPDPAARRHDERLAAASGFDLPDVDPHLASASVGFNLVRVAKKIERDVETNFARPAGLTFAGFRLMTTLKYGGPMSPRRLADLLSVASASVTSGMHTLERAGLLTRTPQPDDGRMLVVALTKQGETVIDEFLHWWTTHREKSWLEHLTPDEEITLAHLLAKVSQHQPQPLAEPQRRLIPPH